MDKKDNLVEEWLPVVGFEGLYEVSNLGRVRSLDRIELVSKDKVRQRKGRTMKPTLSGGYLRLTLCKDGKTYLYFVHVLVAIAFIGPRTEGMDVGHLNEICTDNRLCNLCYQTRKENINWGTRTERMVKSQSIPIVQYDLDGNVVKHWNSISEAARALGIHSRHICSCLKRRHNAKVKGYFMWQYESEYQQGIRLPKYINKSAKKRIGQYLNGILINVWDCAYKAAKDLKLSQGSICRCANGVRYHCGGFEWKYL